MTPDTEARWLAVLELLEPTLRALQADLKRREGRDLEAAGRIPAPRAAASAGGAKRVATASEMDADKGDPIVKWDPPRWKKANKPSEAGYRLSECSADYLDAVADFADFKADKPMAGKEQYVESDRQMAALARGWAERRRAAPAAPPPTDEFGPGDDDIPF